MKSVTFKCVTIAILTLLLLIPGALIQSLITERQQRSFETVSKINGKWGDAQTLAAPLLIIPYSIAVSDKDKKQYDEEHTLNVTPEELKIDADLLPEERHYGIYKAILYKSEINFEGVFPPLADLKIDNVKFRFNEAQIAICLTDLKGVAQNPDLKINGKQFRTTVGNPKNFSAGRTLRMLVADLKDVNLADSLRFECSMRLNGSGSVSFIPLGRHTAVTVGGRWPSPSFIGGFSPESTVDKEKFAAVWNILNFNREIPDMWRVDYSVDLTESSFGVNLIETVDRYQQNTRCAKYALMFIALTFISFFFVEILTKKTIHFFQYALVGVALILFYSLLLSLSEQVDFSCAYLIASAATILMTTVYFYSLIKQLPSTIVLAGIMVMLYTFLYVILQIEDFALLLGSVFLFVILGVIMFVSNKIKIGSKAGDGGIKAGEG